jgi:hypothetical protein
MYGGPDIMNMPPGGQFVTKLKTKILVCMDYVLQCRNDEEAMNGWRLLCSHGVSLVRLALEEKRFDVLDDKDRWVALAESVIARWPPKTYEKTSVTIQSSDRYLGKYDHYSVQVQREDLDLGMRSLEKEKYNVINNTLMALWGDAYSCAQAARYLDIDETIEIPVRREYGDHDISDELASRSGSKRRLTDDQIRPK